MVYARQMEETLASGEFYNELGNAFYLSTDKLQGDYSPVRYRRELKLLRRFCPSGKVLDIGCSSGGFLYYLQQNHPRDYQTLGSDVSRPALAHAAEMGVQTLAGDIFQADLPENSFDAVCFWAVLEHVAEPKVFLRRAHELLKPGGVCFILVPNFQSLAQRLLGAKYRYVLPQHVNYFTPDTLAKLLGKDFAVIHQTTSHFNPVVILKDWRGKTPTTDQDRAALLVKTNRLKQNKLLLPVQMAYAGVEKLLGGMGLADNCVLVARKV